MNEICGFKIGLCVLFGLFLNLSPCESRAVNISNTWTLPQEGFSVFYRYFRDKISWFEADAVCQFHHANLVTVDNGVQFDAARAFLKELDVTGAVWIGLMRPQNSERFAWTNSKPLEVSSGYWAESIPAMEQPLCAVIDPIRDFRWHALRCGGPETAAFLCELPVPLWAADCTITSMPSLTVQYMSDSGAVQLSRDCGEQGTKHMSCQGKQDRDTILQQLQCTDDESVSSVDSNNLPGDITTSSVVINQKAVQDILRVASNNDEDNTIEINPNQIENTVKNVINKFNLEDLMQGDQPVEMKEESEEEVKKTPIKKVDYSDKKDKYSKKIMKEIKANKKYVKAEKEEVMLGDQPFEEPYALPVAVEVQKETEAPIETTTIQSTTEDARARRATEDVSTSTQVPSTTVISTTPAPTTTELPTTTVLITSPEPTTEATTTTTAASASHILPTTPKKEFGSTGDHFIPPMLLVKARFLSTHAHTEGTTPELVTEASEAPSSSSSTGTTEETTTVILNEEVYSVAENGSDVQVMELNEKSSTTAETPGTPVPNSTEHQMVEVTFEDKVTSAKVGSITITTRPFTTKEVTTTMTPPSTTVVVATSTTSPEIVVVTEKVVNATTEIVNATEKVTTEHIVETETVKLSTTTDTNAISNEHVKISTEIHDSSLSEEHHDDEHEDHDDHEHDDEENEETEHQLHNSFSNAENYQPYKPNRRRTLTKNENPHHSGNYIKKILG